MMTMSSMIYDAFAIICDSCQFVTGSSSIDEFAEPSICFVEIILLFF
jgi:hypothetical protein